MAAAAPVANGDLDTGLNGVRNLTATPGIAAREFLTDRQKLFLPGLPSGAAFGRAMTVQEFITAFEATRVSVLFVALNFSAFTGSATITNASGKYALMRLATVINYCKLLRDKIDVAATPIADIFEFGDVNIEPVAVYATGGGGAAPPAQLSRNAGNALVIHDTGLYAAAQDIVTRLGADADSAGRVGMRCTVQTVAHLFKRGHHQQMNPDFLKFESALEKAITADPQHQAWEGEDGALIAVYRVIPHPLRVEGREALIPDDAGGNALRKRLSGSGAGFAKQASINVIVDACDEPANRGLLAFVDGYFREAADATMIASLLAHGARATLGCPPTCNTGACNAAGGANAALAARVAFALSHCPPVVEVTPAGAQTFFTGRVPGGDPRSADWSMTLSAAAIGIQPRRLTAAQEAFTKRHATVFQALCLAIGGTVAKIATFRQDAHKEGAKTLAASLRKLNKVANTAGDASGLANALKGAYNAAHLNAGAVDSTALGGLTSQRLRGMVGAAPSTVHTAGRRGVFTNRALFNIGKAKGKAGDASDSE